MSALVTGGARRLGRAMVLELARRGHDVAVHYDRSSEEAEATAAEARRHGVRAMTFQADLLDADAVAGLVGRVAEALGALTVLVNNASIFEYDTLATASAKSWDRAMGSNLRAPMFLMQAFAAQAPKAGRCAAGEPVARANIINMIDQRVLKLTPGFSSYTLAKYGLWGLTQTGAQFLAPDIRVNAIGPGPTMKGARQSEEHFSTQRAAVLLQRGADDAEIARCMGFILDSPSMTGQLICMDGGQHLAWKTPDILGVE
ncbi:MAG: SDR family oxidoreductase [Paracoccaceae bacterium]